MHHQDILREGVGGGVQEEAGDGHPLLDRGPPQRSAAVAGQGPAADGVSGLQVQLPQLGRAGTEDSQ